MVRGARVSAAIALAVVCGCSKKELACEELNRFAPKGIVIASEETRCQAILDFAATTKDRYGLEFSEWLDVVFPQKARLLLDMFQALTLPGPLDKSWRPASFPREPAEVPCGKGKEVTEGWWKESVLSKVVRDRPEKLYVSLALDISGDLATVRVYQDFDCDGVLGVTEVSARFRAGLSPSHGGWEITKPTVVPDLEE